MLTHVRIPWTQGAPVAWKDVTTPGWYWGTVRHPVHPVRVYVLVLRDSPFQLGPANDPAPLVTRLVRLTRTVQTEVTVGCRRIVAPEDTSHCRHCSPATIVGAMLSPCAARTVGTVSLVQEELPHLDGTPITLISVICLQNFRDPQPTHVCSNHASRSHPRHCHNRRPSSQPFNATRISVSSFAGTLFCSSSLTRTEPLTALLCSPAMTL